MTTNINSDFLHWPLAVVTVTGCAISFLIAFILMYRLLVLRGHTRAVGVVGQPIASTDIHLFITCLAWFFVSLSVSFGVYTARLANLMDESSLTADLLYLLARVGIVGTCVLVVYSSTRSAAGSKYAIALAMIAGVVGLVIGTLIWWF